MSVCTTFLPFAVMPGRHAPIRRSLTISGGMTPGGGAGIAGYAKPQATGPGHVPPECSPAELSRKLQDHLVYQEQEIEFNRIKLNELEKGEAFSGCKMCPKSRCEIPVCFVDLGLCYFELFSLHASCKSCFMKKNVSVWSKRTPNC